MHAGTDINCLAVAGRTPLIESCSRGHVLVSKYLIKKGAKIESSNTFGKTPLIYAIEKGHIDVVKMLLKHKASVKVVTNDGSTPISIATKMAFHDIARMLKAAGASVGAVINPHITSDRSGGGVVDRGSASAVSVAEETKTAGPELLDVTTALN